MNTPETNTPATPAVPKAVVNAAIAGTVLIGIGAAVLSFTALADLAVRAGTPRGLSYVWPIIVDGVIVVATIAIVALRSADSRARSYAWLLLGFGAVISIIANGAHAVVAAAATTPQWMAVTVASVPPVVLLSITHLTVILARRARASQPANHAAAAPTDPDDQPSSTTDDWEDLLEAATATSHHHAASQPATGQSATTAAANDQPATPQQVSQSQPSQPATASAVNPWQPPARQPATGQSASQPRDGEAVNEMTVMSPATIQRRQLHAVPSTSHQPGTITSQRPTTSQTSTRPAVNQPAATTDDDGLADWIRATVTAGDKPTAPAAVAAGLATSDSTARRRIKALRETSPELFQPATVSEHTA